MKKHCRIVGNILGKPVITKDLWGKNDLEHLEDEVTPVPNPKVSENDDILVGHVRRVRGGWDIRVHKR
jgi:hypothetical protein